VRVSDTSIGIGGCAVFVIHTDEELMISRHAENANRLRDS
jgi:acetate kinase